MSASNSPSISDLSSPVASDGDDRSISDMLGELRTPFDDLNDNVNNTVRAFFQPTELTIVPIPSESVQTVETHLISEAPMISTDSNNNNAAMIQSNNMIPTISFIFFIYTCFDSV
jgi:hypothetical protein